MSLSDERRPRLVGLNHVAIDVGSVEEALIFYGRIFDVKLRGTADGAAFVDMGDQFMALMQGSVGAAPGQRHFGLVVDDRSAVMALAATAGAELLAGSSVGFLDPWGNRVEVVEYADIQFTKAEQVLRGMGLELRKSEAALRDLAAKGMAPHG